MGENAFLLCSGLVEITIPSTLSAIPNRAFEGVSSLKNLRLSEGLETIGSRAFLDAWRLSSVTLSSTISFLGNNCFVDCRQLESVIFLGDAPLVDANAFEGASAYFRVYYVSSRAGFTTPTWVPTGLSFRTYNTQPLLEAPKGFSLWKLGYNAVMDQSLSETSEINGRGLIYYYALDLNPYENSLGGWDTSGVQLSELDRYGYRTASLSLDGQE